MSDRLLRTALAGVSLAGVAVTAYLLSARWGSVELLCTTGGCETVQSSSYAEILGVPVAAAGLLAYVALGASAFFSSPLVRVGAASIALAAVAFSAYLLVVQLVVIEEICTWCVVSDGLVTLAAAAVLLRVRLLFVAAPAPSERATSRAARPRGRSGRAPRGSRGGASA